MKAEFFDIKNLRWDKRRSPFFTALIVAALYFVFYYLTQQIIGEFDIIPGLVGAVIFFIVYFFLQKYINRKLDSPETKRPRKKKQ